MRMRVSFSLLLPLLVLGGIGCEAPCYDLDGDGHFSTDACDGLVDCDDTNPLIWSSQPESCDGIDNDCDQRVDEDFDADGDGVGSCSDSSSQTTVTDCDDSNPSTYPDASEVCDGVDNNCNGVIDELDDDGDGASPCDTSSQTWDCNDDDASVHPGASETCNGQDDNCNGQVDEGLSSTLGYQDQDGDAYGVTESAWTFCTLLPTGWVASSGDCNDGNDAVHPGAAETCNGIDDNCSGAVDEGLTILTWYLDSDSDGYGLTSSATPACAAPSELWKLQPGDCNDDSTSISPAALETCDSLDNDCDGAIDEGFDADGDGFTLCAGDCDDARADIAPGHSEVCDAMDNNCNGQVDEGFDQDGDGSPGCAGDCNDNNPNICPGKTEVCDGIDNNCDGVIDHVDLDQDGDDTLACGGLDCNDANPSIHSQAIELCNGSDDDCDGLTDAEDPDAPDVDGDGAASCGQYDCDDTDPSTAPNQPETCDGLDHNCDGIPDNRDEDADGVIAAACGGEDCDDDLAEVNPYTQEVCDSLDNNCDGQIDEALDADGDGFTICTDCDDADDCVFPGAEEQCNDVDDNCNGQTDDGIDQDGDGYSGCASSGCSDCSFDCQDTVAWVYPGAAEVCDGYDSDCNGVEEGLSCDPTIAVVKGSSVYRTGSGTTSFLFTGGPFHPQGRLIIARGFTNLECVALDTRTLECYATSRCDTELGKIEVRYEHPGAASGDCSAASSPDFACTSIDLLEGAPDLVSISPDPIPVFVETTLRLNMCNPNIQAQIFVGEDDICEGPTLSALDQLECTVKASNDSTQPVNQWSETLIYVAPSLKPLATDYDAALALCGYSGVECQDVAYSR